MFKNKYRLRRDRGGITADCKRWWFPIWICIQPGSASAWASTEDAEIAIVRHTRFGHRHVLKTYDDADLLAITRRLEGKEV